jgi:hypothetical protein
VTFENCDRDRILLRLINTREFQRLRRIKQLGFSETVFPGANHNRFSHSIGVLHIAKLFIERIKLLGCSLDQSVELVVLAGALLHDVGHGPFSHAFEQVTKENHERRTCEIVEDSSTEIHTVLASHDPQLPQKIAQFWDEESTEGTVAVPGYLTHIISSQLDADRFDYLLRDSYAAGVGYGNFDHRWLISHLHVDEAKSRLYLNYKSLLPVEQYIFARYHMYRTVYFHKTTRAAEVMLRLLFKRYRTLIQERTFESALGVVPHAPLQVVKAFLGTISLEEYLRLDDHSITEFLKSCQSASDPILRELGAGLLNRHYFKAIDASVSDQLHVSNFQMKVVELIKAKGLDPEFTFASDTPGDTPYKVYDPDSEAPNTQIYVEPAEGQKPREISALSEPVKTLTQKYSLLRFYFPAELRNDIHQIAKTYLGS